MKKKATLKQKFRYWFDNKMSGGSFGLVKLLTIVTVITALIIACIMQALGTLVLDEYDTFSARLWASFSSIINSFIPYYNEGSPEYRILVTIPSIYGMFFTSMLIGIISNALDEKLNSLKKGNVAIMEENHIVVLGFEPGEYSLIQELVYGADKRPCCIVVASSIDREEMEESIRDNVICPKNVRILCRTINIFDPNTLERCSIDTCRTILVSPMDNEHTIRILLAVTRLLHNAPDNKAKTIAVLPQSDYRIPENVIEKYNMLLLRTEGTIARIMAHSCTQHGILQTMMEMFHFDGSEMHIITLPGMQGMTFEELLCRVDDAFPIGICKGKDIYLNPDPDMIMEAGDRLLVFCEESDSAKLLPATALPPMEKIPPYKGTHIAGRLVIFGYNEFLPTILFELPENVVSVTLVNVEEQFREELVKKGMQRKTQLSITFFEKNTDELSTLEELAKIAKHVLILSDYDKSYDESDMKNIFMILTLRDIRERLGLNFNITAEMQRENNQNLLVPDNNGEFIVSSNMSSLFLAQLSESPELIKVFHELLTNEGNEVYLKTAEEMSCVGTRTILELRRRLMPQHYVMIGYMKAETYESFFKLSLNDSITLNPKDKLIVIGED